jgi:hypothetical protein
LVEADFPRGIRQPVAIKRQNASLQRMFNIDGFPTVVVLNGDGQEVGRLGYQQGGPDPFIKALKKL